MLSRYRVVLGALVVVLAAGGIWSLNRGTATAPMQSASPAVTATNIATSHAAVRPASVDAAQESCAAFTNWLSQYSAASGAERTALQQQGVEAAQARRDVMLGWIQNDPKRAMENAFPEGQRSQVPPEVAALLEHRVTTVGELAVLGVAPSANSNQGQGIKRIFTTADGTRYTAHVYGKMAARVTTPQLPVDGVAIGTELALGERPLRPLQPGEVIPAGTLVAQVCPVSGLATGPAAGRTGGSGAKVSSSTLSGALNTLAGVEATPSDADATVASDEAAVKVGNTVYYICRMGHIMALETNVNTVIAQYAPVAQSAYTQGNKTVLLIRAVFPDAPTPPRDYAACSNMLAKANVFLKANSFDSMNISSFTVTPAIMMPQNSTYYSGNANGDSLLMTDAKAAATTAGYPPGSYDFFALLNMYLFNFGGQGFVGVPGIWLQPWTEQFEIKVFCHEIGHNFGLSHANSWTPSAESPIGAGAHLEYGDVYDTMGSGQDLSSDAYRLRYHYNSYEKQLIGWIPSTHVTTATTNGIYRVSALDAATLPSVRTMALSVPELSDRSLWVDVRSQFTGSPFQASEVGVHLRWTPWYTSLALNSGGGTQLLDSRPGTSAGLDDAPVTPGFTFPDYTVGTFITPLAHYTGSPTAVDVQIYRGFFPTNHAPTIQIAASSTNIAVNGTVNFTATATDSDGDRLGYGWEYGTGTVGSNLTAVAERFTSAGWYRVQCTATDMKGGLGIASVMIKVGSPSGFFVSGRVVDQNGAGVIGARVHNGQSGSSYRGGQTDNQGYFTLPGISGAVTLYAVHPYFNSTTPGSVALNVSADTGGVLFTADVQTYVSAGLADVNHRSGGTATIAEDGLTSTNSAAFEVYRAAFSPSTAPLTVNFKLNGKATPGADYNVTGATSFNNGTRLGSITIPASKLSAQFFVTAVNDTNTEGNEPILFQLTNGTYTLSSTAQPVINIQDDDAKDYFTELFSGSGDNCDLANKKLTFTPDGSKNFYRLTVQNAFAYPNSTTSDTVLAKNNAATVPVTSGSLDDGYWTVSLASLPVSIYGTNYTSVRVSSNGRLSFGKGYNANGATTTFLTHFTNGSPDVAGLARDLYLNNGGTLSYQLITTPGAQRAVFTYDSVALYNASGSASFQIELWQNGRITLTHLATTALNGLVGISSGAGYPSDFAESDLSQYPAPSFLTLRSPNGGNTWTNGQTATVTWSSTNSTASAIRIKLSTNSGATYPITLLASTADDGSQVVSVPNLTSTKARARVEFISTSQSDASDSDFTISTGVVVPGGGSIKLSAASSTIAESGGTNIVTVLRTGGSNGVASANIVVVSGSATSVSDYTLATTTVSWGSGVTTPQQVRIVINDDALVEGTETVRIGLTNFVGVSSINPALYTLSITDNDVAVPGTVNFTKASASQAEAVSTYTAYILRTVGTSGTVAGTVQISGTATVPGDASVSPQSFSWSDGQSAPVPIVITVTNDSVVEPNESVVLTLQLSGAGTLGTTNQFTYTILNDDSVSGVTNSVEYVGDILGLNQGAVLTQTKSNLFVLMPVLGTTNWASASRLGLAKKTKVLAANRLGSINYTVQKIGSVLGVQQWTVESNPVALNVPQIVAVPAKIYGVVRATADMDGDDTLDLLAQKGAVLSVLLGPDYDASVSLISVPKQGKLVGAVSLGGTNVLLLLQVGKKVPTAYEVAVGDSWTPVAATLPPEFALAQKILAVTDADTNSVSPELINLVKGYLRAGTSQLLLQPAKAKVGKVVGPR